NTYLLKIQNGNLHFSDYPGERLNRKLSKVVGADVEELLLLAQKVPDSIKKRVIKRPEVFRKLASLDDKGLDEIEKTIDDMLRGMDPRDEDNPKSQETRSSRK